MNTTNNFRGEFEVTVKKKKVKGTFTMNAIRLVMRGEGVSMDGFDKYIAEDPLTAIPTIGYYACINEAVKSGKELKLNKEQFIAEVLDNGGLDAISDAVAKAFGSEEGNE